MIVDTLSNHDKYTTLNPRFAKAFEYVTSQDFNTLPFGKYEICGKDIFMIWGENELKKPENALLEVHNKYIDIQIIVCGTESFGWAERSSCKVAKSEFDPKNDIMFFDDTPSTYVTLHSGEFIILMPHDAHAPLVGHGSVRKCIVKVLA